MAIQQIGASGPSASVALSRAKPSDTASIAKSAESVRGNPVPTPSTDELSKAIEQIKQVIEPVARNLQFSIDGESGRTVVRVVDTQTKEVIRQIPSAEILAIDRALSKLQGLLLHKKA
jgi:flagellar protein FlaG